MWRVPILALLALADGPVLAADPAPCAGRSVACKSSSARSCSPSRRTRRCAPLHSRCGCRSSRSSCASSPAGSRSSSTPSARRRRGWTSWRPAWMRGCRATPGRGAAPPVPTPASAPSQEIAGSFRAAARQCRRRSSHPTPPRGRATCSARCRRIPFGTGRRRPMHRNHPFRRGWRRRGPTRPTGRRSTSCRGAAGVTPSRPSNSS